MPEPYDIAPEVNAPDLPGRVVVRPAGEDVYDAAASELFSLSIDCVRALGDFHLALSVSPGLEGLYQRLMVDPKFRALPWERTHLWLACEQGDGDVCGRELRELIIEHAGIPGEQAHLIADADDYQGALRETLAWREPGHDRLDGVVLALDDPILTGGADPPDADLVVRLGDGLIRLSGRAINASRWIGVLGLGAGARERLGEAGAGSPIELAPVGGRLCWYLDHAACVGDES